MPKRITLLVNNLLAVKILIGAIEGWVKESGFMDHKGKMFLHFQSIVEGRETGSNDSRVGWGRLVVVPLGAWEALYCKVDEDERSIVT